MNDIDRARLKRGPKPPAKPPAPITFDLRLAGWPGLVIGLVILFSVVYTVVSLMLRVLP